MDKVGKLAAFAILLVPYNLIAIKHGLNIGDWRYWIVEKLNKIK